jgi:hypothetical protein
MTNLRVRLSFAEKMDVNCWMMWSSAITMGKALAI